jgi:zinc protease
LPQERVVAALGGLAAFKVTKALHQPLEPMPEIKGRKIFLVNKDGAAQSSVRIAQPSIPFDALGDFYRAGLANFTLGGTFNSRINLNLREDKGYTYGARSRFSGDELFGDFGFSAEVKKDATAASVGEVLKEMKGYVANGMSEEEYDYMRSAIGQRDALRYETPNRKLDLLGNILRYDLPLDYRTRQIAILRETDRESLNKLVRKLIRPADMDIVVVGDEKTIRSQLEKLEIPIRELNADGLEIPGK